MSSPPSSSEEPASSSFELLDPRIQRWIWLKGWTELREAQEQAIPLLINPAQDVIIMAATASGKTEAAFLPILTHLKRAPQGLVVYISPLKALINDQWRRLDELCEHLEIPVTPWHGDITVTKKRRFEKAPQGCLLITPESFEAMLMRNGHSLARIFANTCYVVIDELHAFLDGVRGRQLQSQLHRLEHALGRRITRVGLSATLGDPGLAKSFLRPGDSQGVRIIEDASTPLNLQMLVKGYLSTLDTPPGRHPLTGLESDEEAIGEGRETREDEDEGGEEMEDEKADGGLFSVTEDLFKLRGSNNLIFPNSRPRVELIADLLRRKCENAGVPNEFWPHHGSLSKEIREDAERALKAQDRPATAIATTTLELGIDIGAVKRVAQIGPAPGVSSLRQRLGRSGRRAGEPAILLAYAMEKPIEICQCVSDQLREGLVQTCAQIRLLLKRWYEPPLLKDLHLSTLVQQLLALIGQNGGIEAGDAWQILIASGVFHGLSKAEFATLLRELGTRDILQQEPSGLLLAGGIGERIINHYSFYAAFVTDEEFRIVTKGKTLGTLPIARPLVKDSYVIFAGRRWKVLECNLTDKIIEVAPSKAGKVPAFTSSGGLVHDEVRAEMRRVLAEKTPLSFLNKGAQTFLEEGRATYARLELDTRQILELGSESWLFTWKGDRVNDTLAIWLTQLGCEATNEGLAVGVFEGRRDDILDALRQIAEGVPPAEAELARGVTNLLEQKWDHLLPEPLLRKGYGMRRCDVEGARKAAREILGSEQWSDIAATSAPGSSTVH